MAMKINPYQKILIAICVMALSGCSGIWGTRKHPAQVDDIGTVSKSHRVESSNKETVRGSKAVIKLMNKAKDQSKSGDNIGAAATIERALRIEPKNPALWHNLALVKYKHGDCRSAVNMAKKSNSYSPKGHILIEKNSQIISECRK